MIIDHFNIITDKVPTGKEKKSFEALKQFTRDLIKKHKPIMVMGDNEYPMGYYDVTDLKPGMEATITEIGGDRLMKYKLQGFGIIPGSTIKFIRKGLGLNVYDVKSSFVAIRNEDAKKIKIKLNTK